MASVIQGGVRRSQSPAAATAAYKTRHGDNVQLTAARLRNRPSMAAAIAQSRKFDRPATYGPPDRFGGDLSDPPRFRFFAELGTSGRVPLTRITQCSWDDVNAILTGSLTLREDPFGDSDDRDGQGFVRLDQGDRVVCEVTSPTGAWGELWDMRITKPRIVSVNNRERGYDLANDLDLLRQSEGNFYYGSTTSSFPTGAKKKYGGWFGDEIIRDICSDFQVPVGAIAPFAYLIPKLLIRRGSPLEVIRNVLLKEYRQTGRRMVVRWQQGRLYILPLQRAPHLRALGPQLLDAAMQSEMREEFGTALTIHGLHEFVDNQNATPKGRKKPEKMHVTLESKTARERYGYVHRIVFSPDARTDADLRTEGLAYLAAVAQPHKTVTLQTPGIPSIRRGDAITLALGDEELWKQIVYVNRVSNLLMNQRYTQQIDVIFDDPYVDKHAQTILNKLKSTHDEAVGNRARVNPTWYYSPNNKSDVSSAPPGEQQIQIFGGGG